MKRKDESVKAHHTQSPMNRPEDGAGRNPNNYPWNENLRAELEDEATGGAQHGHSKARHSKPLATDHPKGASPNEEYFHEKGLHRGFGNSKK